MTPSRILAQESPIEGFGLQRDHDKYTTSFETVLFFLYSFKSGIQLLDDKRQRSLGQLNTKPN